MNETTFHAHEGAGKETPMKTVALIAITGSLAAVSAPAQAVEFDPATHTANLFHASPAFEMRLVSHLDDDDWDDDDRVYDRRGRYREPRRIRSRDRVWRGRDGRYYCKRDNGTTGLVIGAGVGALLGRTIDTRGDRTVGTLLGGALGAVIGRELDRGDIKCR